MAGEGEEGGKGKRVGGGEGSFLGFFNVQPAVECWQFRSNDFKIDKLRPCFRYFQLPTQLGDHRAIRCPSSCWVICWQGKSLILLSTESVDLLTRLGDTRSLKISNKKRFLDMCKGHSTVFWLASAQGGGGYGGVKNRKDRIG